jgi:hypothetical protein
MLDKSLNIFRQIMAILCCLFGLPGNILTIIVCIRALCRRTINFQRKVFHLYLIEISILGKLKILSVKESLQGRFSPGKKTLFMSSILRRIF